jgi:hypothetical protein
MPPIERPDPAPARDIDPAKEAEERRLEHARKVDSSINEVFSAGEVRGDQLLI